MTVNQMTPQQESASVTISVTVAGYGISYAVTSVLSVVVFLLLGALLNRKAGGIYTSGNALISNIVGTTVIGWLIIAGYFAL